MWCEFTGGRCCTVAVRGRNPWKRRWSTWATCVAFRASKGNVDGAMEVSSDRGGSTTYLPVASGDDKWTGSLSFVTRAGEGRKVLTLDLDLGPPAWGTHWTNLGFGMWPKAMWIVTRAGEGEGSFLYKNILIIVHLRYNKLNVFFKKKKNRNMIRIKIDIDF